MITPRPEKHQGIACNNLSPQLCPLKSVDALAGKHTIIMLESLREDSNKKIKIQKTVRFSTRNQVDVTRLELTEEERKRTWWDGETRRTSRNAALQIHSPLHQQDAESQIYLANFREASKVCQSAEKLGKLPLVSDTPARGLEQRIFPEIVQMRQRSIFTLLRAQDDLPPNASPEQKACLLCAVSKKLSRPSRRLARFLAVGDAKVASCVVRSSRPKQCC